MIAKMKSFEITVELTDVYRKKTTTRHKMNKVLYCALVTHVKWGRWLDKIRLP